MIYDPTVEPSTFERMMSALARWSAVILLGLGLLAIAWSVDFTGG